jgi:Ca2+/Na+ antiporter
MKALGHLNIVFAGLFLTFFIIDQFNPAMMYIDNPITKWLLCCFTLLVLAYAILTLRSLRMGERRRQQQQMQRRERTRRTYQ